MIGELVEKLLPFFNKSTKNTNSIPGISGYEKVGYILSSLNNALSVVTSDVDRCSEMWNLYSGIDDCQYPINIQKKMKDENRNPFQGNFIRQKVDGLAGSITKNFMDIDFVAINSEFVELTRKLKDLMMSDKELLDWNRSDREVLIDGLVHLGVEEIYVDYRYSPFGNIGFKRLMPGHIILDPDWLSNDSLELKRAFKIAYLTPTEIKEIYKTKSEDVDLYVKMKMGDSLKFENSQDSENIPHSNLNDIYGDRHRVIEYHHMEKEKQKVKIAVANGLVIPEGPDEIVQAWAELNGVDLNEGVITREEELDVYYVTTICPSISNYLVLEDKKGLIQIGRLPFFPWSCARINGKNSGIPDLLKSIQRTYNYRESMLDYMISTSANGAHIIDPLVVDNDAQKMKVLVENWNKSSFKMFSSPGAISSGREFVKELPRSNVDYGIVQELTRMLDIADLISKQPATMDGRSEGSEETGILYARKQLRAEITQTILIKSKEQHQNDKGEAYALLAKQLYSGVYREFYVVGSNKKVELNVPTVTNEGVVLDNDISMLPRIKVIVSQSPEGATTRDVDRALNTELLRVIGEFSPMNRALAVKNVMKTLNNSKEERIRYEEASQLEYELARESTLSQTEQMRMARMQMQMQMMPQQPQQEQPIQENPGNPAGSFQGNAMNAGTPPTQ